MQTRIVDLASLSDDDEQAWRALAGRAAQPNPFAEPDFLVPSAQHFEGFAQTKLVVVHDGPAMRAVLPVVSTQRRRIPPRPVAATRGHPTAVSAASTPLVDVACARPALEAMFDTLAATGRRALGAGVVSFDRQPEAR